MAAKFCMILLTVTLTIAKSQSASKRHPKNPDRPPVHFNVDGTFKIVTFTDLHYGEGTKLKEGAANDLKSTKVMYDVLKWENPDFVVFTGDLMSAEVMYPNGTAVMDQLLEPVVKGGYKWATTYGNHGIGKNVSREELLRAEQKYVGCCTKQGKAGLVGNTNYYIPIYPPKKKSEGKSKKNRDGRRSKSKKNQLEKKPALVLWFFDSRGGWNSTGRISKYVHKTVLDWFKDTNGKMNRTWGSVPSLAFFHYPTEEYKPIHKKLRNGDHPECTGQRDDVVTPQQRDVGLMDALVNAKTVRAVFVGHNHGNGWCCNYKALALCYNRQSGHGGRWKDWIRGSRVLKLSMNDLWGPPENFIRLENGKVVDRFVQRVNKH